MTDRKMFLRIVTQAMVERPGRILIALAALLVGSAVTSAMLSVYHDAQLKMTREVRAFGANVMITPTTEGALLRQSVLEETRTISTSVQIIGAAPYLYTVVSVRSEPADTQSVVLVGIWFDQVKNLSPWWQVDGRLPEEADPGSECVVGAAIARQLGLRNGDKIRVGYGVGKLITGESHILQDSDAGAELTVSGIVTTGAVEDDRIFASLQWVQQLTGMKEQISAVAISALGAGERIEQYAGALTERLDAARAVPVRQIAESETRLLGKLRLMMLLVSVFVLLGVALSVSTTLTALVIERRREIGTMKAIGASDSDLLRLFLCELGTLSVVAAIAGYAIGLAIAQFISMRLFNSPVAPQALVLVTVIGLSILVVAGSGIVPIRRMREVQPALILRGD